MFLNFHISSELVTGNFPTVGLSLNKLFWLLPGKSFWPPCKNFFRIPWWQARKNILSKPHIANISRRSCSCHKWKTIGTISLQ